MSKRSAIVSLPPQSHRSRGFSLPDGSLGLAKGTLLPNDRVRRTSDCPAPSLPIGALRRQTTIRRIYTGHEGREGGENLSNGNLLSLDPSDRGEAICFHLAQSLRKIVCGTTLHSLSTDFKRSIFQFQSVDGPFAFGLIGERNGARTVIICVQAQLLKQLIFQHRDRDTIRQNKVLKPQENERKEKLITCLSEILWRAGQNNRAAVCLVQRDDCFLVTDRRYHKDGITEKLLIFKFESYETLRDFIGKHLNYFQSVNFPGILLFVYSVVLSRTIEGVKQDSGDERIQLLSDNEQCNQAMVNLLLTGQAAPYVHNGDVEYDEHAQLLSVPQKGIRDRAQLGFLYYHNEESDRHRTKVGSMLKTPKFPIWVTLVNGHPGLLFSLNPDLVNDWRAEHKIFLHYYTGLITQRQDVVIQVDTRLGQQLQSRTKEGKRNEEKRIPVLEKCIMTKWPGAHIEWQGGVLPFLV